MSDLLPDEACHVRDDFRIYSMSELELKDSSGDVILHNTMRFDVQLAYIQPMLDYGEVDKQELVIAIRNAIVAAVGDVVGDGLDDVPILGACPVSRSKMLHRETILFDFS
jgi:hypothetical protein